LRPCRNPGATRRSGPGPTGTSGRSFTSTRDRSCRCNSTKKKDETIHLLSGEIVYRVQRTPSDESRLEDVRLQIGESFRITPGTIHQMVAVTDCDVLEVSTPELDDVVRLSDKYRREGTTAP